MKQMFVLTMLLLMSVTAYAGCEKFSAAKDARLGDQINGSDYSFAAVAQIGDDVCISYSNNRDTGGSEWIKFQPSVATQSVSDSNNATLEASICSAFVAQHYNWINAVYTDVKKVVGHTVEISFTIKNANMSGKLKRDIICSPSVFGFPS